MLLMGVASSLVARLIERYRWMAFVGLATIVYIAAIMIWHGVLDVRAAI